MSGGCNDHSDFLTSCGVGPIQTQLQPQKNRRFHQKLPVNRVLQIAVPFAANTKMKSGKLLPVPPCTFAMNASIFATTSLPKNAIVMKAFLLQRRYQHSDVEQLKCTSCKQLYKKSDLSNPLNDALLCGSCIDGMWKFMEQHWGKKRNWRRLEDRRPVRYAESSMIPTNFSNLWRSRCTVSRVLPS
jgi:hypothetical protein